MGSCASVHKEQGKNMGVRMRLVSKAKRIFVGSPTKEKEHFNEEKESKIVTGFGSIAHDGKVEPCLAHKSTDFESISMLLHLKYSVSVEVVNQTLRHGHNDSVQSGSKDEIFFDSRAWLESDCEDDFFSVNGEFTPSRGSTPNHPKFSPGTPRMFNLPLNDKFPDTKSEPSPRKKLAELFVEFSETDKSLNDSSIVQNSKTEEPVKMVGSPVVNDNATNSPCASNATTPNIEKKKRDRILNYGSRCCLPALSGVGIDGRRHKASPSPCTV